ncbi:MAG: CCA tRNA nucleotidyltransferase [Methanomassiliicoccaceae archaeon]|jgi:tRNA nucleotidyltransferase (CCA-adding enzyme)|nr:CCA tRNA nucleotidyltransferase [Methanomassiliicoccaceae archaeon]HOL06916.1 CCA tRNA nucleotidyltransferase [Methanomassiliicoccaceae archaeon]HPP44751.1 CCA tRNA nucleotidyltransferase [Methanomassiliicoccaceae archaeon]HQA21567.1 CCA tRNA nucleotidyltransferase [Methanomassiliicoccaceae archaeon]HQD88590.1 CCA tRNA nucleotidyltransferase [Methanomassiliicoccaceae archaeon]
MENVMGYRPDATVMAIEEEVLRRIKPDPKQKERVERAVRSLLDAVMEKARERGPDIKVMLVGSVAKDTYVGDPDIDMFMLFPPTVERKELERKGLQIGKEVLSDGEARYAEHPYIHGTWDGLEVDLVPCYAIEDASQLRSAVDRTPLHTRYVNSNLKDGQQDQVRLLKQFMKGVGTYGAEARTQGFSGYLVELLIIRFGGMREVLEAATSWKKGETLSLGDIGRQFKDPLIFYDPVDKDRNVASALSLNNLALFIHAAQEYLANPSSRFFFPRKREPLPLSRIKDIMEDRGTELLIVQLDRPDLIDDDLFPQVRRTLDGTVQLLERGDFNVYDRSFHVGRDIQLVIELEKAALPRSVRHDGPPAWIGNARSFLEKWKDNGLSEPFLDNGRWVVMARRGHATAVSLVMENLGQAALGSGLRRLEGLSAVSGEDALTEENREAISALLDKRKNWEV